MKAHTFARVGVVAALAFVATACSRTPTATRVVDDAIAAMGGNALRSVRTIAMTGGSGTRLRLQQTRHVADAEEPGTLKDVAEVVDLDGGRASMDYRVTEGGFMQHRHEVLTTRGGKAVGVEYVDPRPVVATSPGGLFSWGTQNSPEMTLHRNLVGILLDAAATAGDTPADTREFDGRMATHVAVRTKNGDDVSLFFDPQTKLPLGFETTDTEALDGDVPAQYVFSDYRAVGAIKLPFKTSITKNGKNYSDVQFASASVNDAAAVEKEFAIPDAASKQADEAIAAGDYSPVEISKIADTVYFAKAYSHNSLVVEFPQWLAVVEAPYTDAQSQTLVRMLKEQFPDKPIRYVAVTHHHSDHIGGVRGLAAAGATILVEKGHAPALTALLEAHHTHPPDSLEAARSAGDKTGEVEVYEEKKAIEDGKQKLELYAFTGSPHVEPMVMAYVPGAKVLFQSDLWFPGTGGAGTPAAKQLYDSIKALKLDVKINAGGHGGVAPFAELENAVRNVPADAQALSGPALVAALQRGGYVIVMRHASSPSEKPDAQHADRENVDLERQLDETGRATADAMGNAFRTLRIPVGQVLSSPTYRARETARRAGWTSVQPAPELGDNGRGMQQVVPEAQADWLRKRVADAPRGTNTVLITHAPNISRAFPEASTGLTDGEALIFAPDGKGGATLAARVKIDDWPRLAR